MTTKVVYPMSEAARERETFQYVCPTDHFGTAAAARTPSTPTPRASLVPSSTADSGLTAFAELGLYRLNGTRSLICLFDRSYQHILAEAIRPSSSVSGSQTAPLTLGGTSVPRTSSVCEHVLASRTESPIAGLPVSVFPDLDADTQFRHRKDPDWRFYAGVPIRSPTGINIGVYCVINTEPRSGGLTEEERSFLQSISPTVMNYLEFRRSNKWCRREDRMTCGLGSFVEGKATLTPPSEQPGRTSFFDHPGVEEGLLNKKLHALHIPSSDEHGSTNNEISKAPQSSQGGPNGTVTPPVACTSTGAQDNHSTSKPTPADVLQKEVECVLSKAANIIRESVQVEGVVFLDASINSFGGLVGKAPEPTLPEGLRSLNPGNDDSLLDQYWRPDEPTCKVLGFSTTESSSINGDAPLPDHTSLPERFLQTLLQQYPRGHIFNFEADGTQSDHLRSDADITPPASPQFQRPDTTDGEDLRAADALRITHPSRRATSSLLKIFPGARSVAIVPLWDPQRNRYFAGGLVWTKTPARTFTVENELNYLKVFSMAAMAKVSRLNTQAAIKTTTDILGSISHELRSPLHGVVGAVELLRDTTLDGFQEGILNAIETSGKTLLDTIDHLLDYSETKNLIHVSHTDQRGSMASLRKRANSTASLTLSVPESPAQLDLLVEEVVESVKAGHSFQAMSDAQFTAWDSSRRPVRRPRAPWRPKSDYLPGEQWSSASKGVQIFLDIDPSAKWSFQTHPGAFRRIVMNLFGNALKFTTAGSITVSLRQEPPSHDGDGNAKVVLAVTDSGRGISEAYLRHHLFTPFSQEDHFSPGTGLGLNLVRQMTSVLGGSINVASSIGHGTTATVALPLSRSDDVDDVEATFQEDVRTLAGRRVQLRGFGSPDDKEQLRRLESILRGWLRMEITPGDVDGSDSASPDFVICAEEDLSHVDAESPPGLPSCPRIFICENSVVARGLCKPNQGRSRKGFDFLSQPIGPRKLAHVLLDSQSRWKESRQSSRESMVSDNSRDYASEPASPALCVSEVSRFPLAEFLGDAKAPSSDLAKLQPVIVETVVAAHDGPESPDSPPQIQALGTGLIVPVVEPRLPKPMPAAGETRPSILIVDDNTINLKILAAYLTKLNHPHTSATNGLEAVERYTQSPGKYSCILTDISMPVMDGLESTRRMRAHERASQLRPAVVIALTGLGGDSVRRDAFASGVDLLLTRPLVLRGLVGALEATGLR